jgi:hypothetical protein
LSTDGPDACAPCKQSHEHQLASHCRPLIAFLDI